MKFGIGLKVKPYHGKIFRYMVENNLTRKQLAPLVGISVGTLCNILTFRWLPEKGRKGSYQSRTVKDKLEKFFGCSIKELFPGALCDQIEKNKEVRDLLQGTKIIHREIELEYLPFYAVPEITYEEDFDGMVGKGELRERFEVLFKNLTPREEKVIKMRFGFGEKEKGYKEIGDEIGLTRERIHQIEAKGLMKLRHPKNAKELKEFCD